ncbi:MAG: lamin tail domain-containing protein, partial [Planctomycetota bacterium]|nr:lamin tail domain-containing protein [Planctomycetota bacterium]
MLIRIPLARLLIALFACTIGLFSIQPPANASNSGLIVITEIMYHPSGGGQELEFIELHNASPAPVDVSGWYFSKGISFTFPPQSFLSGGEYIVICANEQRIAATYDIDNLIGNWGLGCDLEGDERDGCALANNGETIELAEENGVVVATVGFNDRGKWPSAADGTGHTLSLIDIYSDPDDPDSWSISSAPGGTPGAENDPSTGSLTIVINEALLWTAGTRWIELFNRSDQAVDLSGFWVTNSRTIGAEESRFQLPADTSISAGGHLALSEADLGGLDLAPAADEEVVEGSPGRRFIALVEPNGSRVIDAYIF